MALIDPELMKLYGFWGSILALKLLAMVPLTGRQRFAKKVMANPEDLAFVKGGKVGADPDVERVRRAHQNDLENVLPWYAVTFLWLTTSPPMWLASLVIKTFVFARIGHTVAYAIMHQQPLRAITFFIGFGAMVFQILHTLVYYL